MDQFDNNKIGMKRVSNPESARYFKFFFENAMHAMTLMLHPGRRISIYIFIIIIPIPIFFGLEFFFGLAFDNKIFIKFYEQMYLSILSPLLALFFSCMLVVEDGDIQTSQYTMMRSTCSSAWILGRFLTYMLVSSAIVVISVIIMYSVLYFLAKINFTNVNDLKLFIRYLFALVAAQAVYGAFSFFLCIVTKYPIIYGALLLYGWQWLVFDLPGIIDHLTFKKYIEALYTDLYPEVQTAIGVFPEQIFYVSTTKAWIILTVITFAFLVTSIIAVRNCKTSE